MPHIVTRYGTNLGAMVDLVLRSRRVLTGDPLAGERPAAVAGNGGRRETPPRTERAPLPAPDEADDTEMQQQQQQQQQGRSC